MEMLTREIDVEFNELMGRIGNVFPSEPGFRTARKYIQGLMSSAERKNGWQLAEAVGDATPFSVQQFLYRGRFEADGLRDELRHYVGDTIGDEDGTLVPDETGFLKQGKMSCGVKRQYSGTAGRVENCQIGVFLTYAGKKGHAPIDRRLYISEDWFEDPQRCRKAGVPETVTFQTKPQMALEMIQQATASGLPYRWVTGDCVYGDYGAMRAWLEERGKGYVLCVSRKAYVNGFTVGSVLKELDEDGWFEASCGDGAKGVRLYDWKALEVDGQSIEGWKHWLLVRRSKKKPGEMRSYICFAPADTPMEKLIKIAGIRWTVECCFAESKSEVGMDHYEVQSYSGWHKHITLACLALALLTKLSSHSFDKKIMQQHKPAASSLDAFKRGRNLRV